MGIVLGLVQLLSCLVGLGSLACLVMVLMKMFPAEGPIKGVLAILCSLYAFIWGWMNADRFQLRMVMMVWTALVVTSIVLGGLSGALGAMMANSGQ
jgi:hypothetical protein